jgi:repressor of nif and glnA expression
MYSLRNWYLENKTIKLNNSPNLKCFKGHHLIFSTTDKNWFSHYFIYYKNNIVDIRDIKVYAKNLHLTDNVFLIKKFISLNIKFPKHKDSILKEFKRKSLKINALMVLYVILDLFFNSKRDSDYVEVSRFFIKKQIEKIFNVNLTERQIRYALEKLKQFDYIEKKLIKITPITEDGIFKINATHVSPTFKLMDLIYTNRIYRKLFPMFMKSDLDRLVDVIRQESTKTKTHSVNSIMFDYNNMLNILNLSSIEKNSFNIRKMVELILKDVNTSEFDKMKEIFGIKIYKVNLITNKMSEIGIDELDKRLYLYSNNDYYDIIKNHKVSIVFSDLEKANDYIITFNFERLRSIEYTINNLKFMNKNLKNRLFDLIKSNFSTPICYEFEDIKVYMKNKLYLSSLFTYYQIFKNRLEIMKEMKAV